MTAHEKLLSIGYEEQRNELWRGMYEGEMYRKVELENV